MIIIVFGAVINGNVFLNFLFVLSIGGIEIHHSLMIKISPKIGYRRNYLNIIKVIGNGSIAHIYLHNEMLKSFILKIRNKTRGHTLTTFSVNTLLKEIPLNYYNLLI